MNHAIDREELLDQIDNDLEFLGETFSIFNEECPQVMTEIETCIQANDGKRLNAAAHKLKGMLGNFCTDSAAEIAGQLEQCGMSNEFSNAEALWTELVERLGQVKVSLTQMLESTD